MEIYVPERYPLDYNQLLLLFSLLSYVSPDIARVFEFISHSRFKTIGFPLKMTIALYMDVVLSVSLKELKLQPPKVDLMIGRQSCKCPGNLRDLSSPMYIALNASSTDTCQKDDGTTASNQKRRKSETQLEEMKASSVEDSADDITEAAEGKNELKDFASHCSLEVKTMSKVREEKRKAGKHKINYSMTNFVRRQGANDSAQNASLAAIPRSNGGNRKNIERTMTLGKPSDFSANASTRSISKVNLRGRDLLRLFRFSLRGRSTTDASRIRDVDIALLK
eukprot:TRINITY_DN8873_c0_g1_i4.p1 TRINITY_DN8873_c0_g1~~TRINITY_DN8873_c0_g1_i4.p1  ORF type:complete len:321 (+),score=64.56 TRINITY_DN8873_c0_g1_i4:127-963(+)